MILLLIYLFNYKYRHHPLPPLVHRLLNFMDHFTLFRYANLNIFIFFIVVVGYLSKVKIQYSRDRLSLIYQINNLQPIPHYAHMPKMLLRRHS